MAKKKAASKSGPAGSEPIDVAAEAAATFEESLAEVEGIVRELESGQLTLGDSLRAYERGVRELRMCQQHLEKVERRIELLIGFDDQGRPVTEAFEDESMTMEEKQSSRGRRRGAQGGRGAPGGGGAQGGGGARRGRNEVTFGDPDASDANVVDDDSRVDDSPGLF